MAVAPRNDFLVWAGGSNANVLTQAQYAALGNLTSGVVSGKASAQHANKAWRQTSIMSAMIAKFIVDQLTVDVVDDGTIQTIETNFIAAIRSVFVIPNTGVTPGTYGPTMSLAVQADGRITALANGGLTETGIAPGTYVGTTVTVGADGRITGIVGVSYGPLANSNTWAQTQTGAHGFTASGLDAGSFHFRAVGGNYGAGFLNDGAFAYLLSTVTGVPLGIYSAFRPFIWNLLTGAVTIDATARGVTTGGAITAQTGNITASAGRFRALLGARGSGDGNAAAILADFTQVALNPGYVELPNGFMLQWQTATVTAHVGAPTSNVLALPISFPAGNFLNAMVCFQGASPPPYTEHGSLSATPFSGGQVVVYAGAVAATTVYAVQIWSLGF